MKKILFVIQQWWRKMGEEYHRKKIIRMENEIWSEATHRIQAREFNGVIYLCLDGIPITDEGSLVEDLPESIQEARNTFFDYTYYKRRGTLPSIHK